MATPTTPEQLLTTRSHRIHAARLEQITRNLLAIRGGRPYVDARLWRAPNESDLSWTGAGNLLGKQTSTGRKDRAPLVNEAGRIAGKINQYLFQKAATREGIDATFAADCTGTGMSIGAFWETVSEHVTAAGWVWLRADRGAQSTDPETGKPAIRTLLASERSGDRLAWSIWPAADVVDWSFDRAGNLVWLLTAEDTYANADPMAEAKQATIRTLWRRGDKGNGGLATWQRYGVDVDEAGGTKVETLEGGTVSSAEIPFVCVGTPTKLPWWFDDVEMLQAVLLNMGSLHNENLTRTVYPQLVVASSMVNNLEATIRERVTASNGARTVELIREIIRGLDRPFVEAAEESGITRYLMPSAADLDAIPKHCERTRQALFDMVGLALFNRETRQVQSAESKQFDHLDTEATLRHRALVMQDAEKRLIDMNLRIDTRFKTYEPKWPDSFSVPKTAEDVASLTQLANFTSLTPGLRRQVLTTAVRLLGEIDTIPDERRTELLDEIDAEEIEARPGGLQAWDRQTPAAKADAATGGGGTFPPGA